MSLKGGYKIIDLKGIDVTKATMMIEGIYESIESNYGKPLLISGIVIDGVEKDDVFVQATLNGTSYVFDIYGYTIQVQDTDAVGVFNNLIVYNTYDGTEIKLKNGDKILLTNIDETENNIPIKCDNCLGFYINNYNVEIANVFESVEFSLTELYFAADVNKTLGGRISLVVINNILFISIEYSL